jgi:hypothetical protein
VPADLHRRKRIGATLTRLVLDAVVPAQALRTPAADHPLGARRALHMHMSLGGDHEGQRAGLAQRANGSSLHPARDVRLLDEFTTSPHRDTRDLRSAHNSNCRAPRLEPGATTV